MIYWKDENTHLVNISSLDFLQINPLETVKVGFTDTAIISLWAKAA